jgi:CheY-like chemotaxis protein
MTASSGPEGVKAAETNWPDAVLCDLGLPGFDGYEVARRLRAEAKGRELLLAALSGYGEIEDLSKAKEAGFDCHLVKPVDHARLMKLLAGLSPRKLELDAIGT